jgi:membrane fusion protein, copper/silver efflux system
MLLAAKNKLSLWGLTSSQIAAIEKTKKTSPLMTFYSPSEGYTTDVMVKEGMYVEVGTTLLKLTGLKQVWIEAQLYADEKMSNSTRYEIHSTTSPYKEYEGNLVFNNPTIEEGKKVQLLQIRVSNPKNELIPGMNVYVRLKSATETVLTIPKTAILLEKMKTVWVKINATTFEQRMVETGAENKHFIEILSGVTEGEVIASSGAYLINSEFILKSGTEMRHNH